MDRELSLAGVGASQVLRSACVNTRVFSAGVEDNKGIVWVIIHKCKVAAFREKHVILQQIKQLSKWFKLE